MDPLRMNLVWRRNAPDPASYTLTDTDPKTGAVVPVDLTGYTLRLDVRIYPSAAQALASLGMAAAGLPGFVLDDAVGGRFTFTPPTAAQLLAAPWPSPDDVTTGRLDGLAYDCLLIAPDGVPESFWTGSLTLDSGVTRL